MNENHVLDMGENENALGKVEIAPEVIEVIAGIAASEVAGVGQMRGNFASGVVEKLGKKNHGKGVKVELSEEGIKIDVFCSMNYGVSIPTVASQVQDNIREALKNMTALELAEVNVHIVGVIFESPQKEEEIDSI
ncbi:MULTISPECIES: Asp23/Gls24 family envelope stress response protein [Priestia]|jgi:uncharacterized alkaline shock family protein YloU|uniref:Uncharacterized protein n=3 Tax=Priestia TaxID=2800373 RepID=A0A0H4L0D5_9BACI|nr:MULTISPECIES: Asp23/Gls24 family envelope stress response protein [Priestia]AKO94093.1 hypothetical protein BEH_19545 [Priestia filamentosa]KAB2493643.1 Asp23/Gls24 family envelope stress response protein [Priestia endophytica]KYG36024.1 hypothetical protein AZF06_02155 [Priestia endophytica]MBG9814967.1 hypothetical protein [Priestia endophytica]MCM3539554.1 Asp23/Gls24 family envelope stress response protein [Priestia endophytica]